MKAIGAILIVLGILAVIYGGVQYNRQRTVLDVGGIKATATEHKSFPVPPVAGAIAIVAGLVLVFSGRSERRRLL